MGEAGAHRGLPYPLVLSALAIAAVVVARGLAMALPGTFAGTDAEIRWVEMAAAYLTQLCALTFGVIGVRMALQLVLRRTPSGLKLLAVLSMFATLSVVYVSTGVAYHPGRLWLAVMGACAASFALAAAIVAVGTASCRGAALVVLACAAAGLTHLAARWLAISGVVEDAVRAYAAAQAIATFGFLLEWLGALLAFVFLIFAPYRPEPNGRSRLRLLSRPAMLLSIAAVSAALTTALVLAARGTDGWRLLLGRVLGMLSTHPDPLAPPWVSNFLELWVFQTCVLCCLPWGRSPQQRASVVLALLARASVDVPVGALFMFCSALALLAGHPQAAARRTELVEGELPEASSPQ